MTSLNVGHDIEVSSAKGAMLLKVAVKGTSTGFPTFRLTKEERIDSVRDPLWRMVVVSDAVGPAAQHKIYKPTELTSAPGFDPAG